MEHKTNSLSLPFNSEHLLFHEINKLQFTLPPFM